MASELAQNLAYTPLQGRVEYQENNPYNDAAIDETWKYVLGARAGLSGLGLITGLLKPKNILGNEELINNFYNLDNPKLEETPPLYDGERTVESVINFIGNNGILKAPKRNVIFNDSNIPHLLEDNNPERLYELGRIKRTFEEPALIIKGQRHNKDFNYYVKPFLRDGKIRGHLGIARDKDIGNFYKTSFSLRKPKLSDLLNSGQVIYNNLPISTASILKNMPVNNIINYFKSNFNPFK